MLFSFKAGSPPALKISALGFLEQELGIVKEDRKVVLQRAPGVVLVFGNPDLMPEPPVSLRASLVLMAPGGRSWRSVGPRTDLTGSETRLLTEGPGTYHLRIIAVDKSGEREKAVDIYHGAPEYPEIVVTADTAETRFSVPLALEAVSDAVERLRQSKK